MRTLPLAGVFAALLFIGIFGVSYATDQLADHVVINEVDTNPPGDDSKSVVEWVELYNPTDKTVNLAGWQIASTTVAKKTLTLPNSAVIKPGQFLVYSYQTLWFTDVSEKVQLKDKDGKLIDETQTISDQKNDAQSWQRKYDGVVSDANTWVFRMSSPGSSNGKLPGTITNTNELTISTKSDKKSYLLAETATISGNVSKRVYQEKPSFTQQQISINVDGPGKFHQVLTMYPDLNLQYKTKIKLDSVQGATIGTYRVDVTYGQATDSAVFFVGNQQTTVEEQQSEELTISTDKESYIPGQTVQFSASTNTILPGEGLTYSVYDPNGAKLFSGKLYPNKSGEFSGNVFMSPTKPVYGTLDIIADYGKQHAQVSFDLLKDEKDAQKITLTTDKQVYAPSEPIIVTGRSNKYVAALDIEVVQTGTGSIRGQTSKIFQLKDQVTLAGDNSFQYELKIPAGKTTLGDYKFTVSKEFGKASISFKIAENPDTAVGSTGFFIKTDQEKYLAGQTVKVTGHVDLATRSTFEAVPVLISLVDDKGKQIVMDANISNKQLVVDKVVGKTATYSFTAIPDQTGNFKLDFQIPASFTTASYSIRANYDKRLFDTTFAVDTGLDVKNKNIDAKTDKSVYGLGETVTVDGTLVGSESAVKIVLTKPTGKTISDGAKIDNSHFSWSWTTPTTEFETADLRDPKEARPSVFGVYKITLSTSSQTTDIFFKVSKTPALDTLEVKPLEISTDKPMYHAGEKMLVSGAAIKRDTADQYSSVVIDRATVEVKTVSNKVIFTSHLDLDRGGAFRTAYDLPLTVFKDGKYKIVATYQKLRAEASFEIKNDIPLGNNGKITLLVGTDKKQYVPGDIVHITGSTNKVISLQKLNLVVNYKKEGAIDCGNFNCGLGGHQVDISRSYSNGIYSYDYTIPANSAIGTYEVVADTEFGTFKTTFDVVEKLAKKVIGTTKISDKFNRITNSTADVGLFEQTRDGVQIAPSMVQGSLVVLRGSEKTTNLTITADDGTCIIGQAKNCLISGPTKDKTDYKIVKVAGLNYKVTYSGFDQVLEKFSIAPEMDDDVIPDSTWTIMVDKPVPSAKLYYEIVYKQVQ